MRTIRPGDRAPATAGAGRRIDVPIDSLDVSVCVVPTESPESDGTFEWSQTTLIVAEVLHPDRTRPGLGIEFKRADRRRYAAT